MRPTHDDALARLVANTHGVLCTLHQRRGPDPVPVVYVADPDGFVGLPIDRVKPKASGPLQRELNLATDTRATLLVEHWDPDDWSRLWWVRAELSFVTAPGDEHIAGLSGLLAERVPQYVDQPFDRVLVFEITAITAWSAT